MRDGSKWRSQVTIGKIATNLIKTINFYTVILKQSKEYWVSLCLENGLVGQGNAQQQAIDKLQEAIASFEYIVLKLMFALLPYQFKNYMNF